MVVIDLIIVGFACISLVVFAATKEPNTPPETSKVEESEKMKEDEK